MKDPGSSRQSRDCRHQEPAQPPATSQDDRCSSELPAACFAEMFEGSRDGLVVLDAAGRVLATNHALRVMLGHSQEALRSAAELCHAAASSWREWARDMPAHNHSLRIGRSRTCEEELRHKNGHSIPVEIQSYVLIREDASPEYFWFSVRDLAERTEAQERLLEHSTLFRCLFEDTDILVFSIEAEASGVFRFNYFSGAFERILGQSADAFLGKTLDDLVPAMPVEHIENLKRRYRACVSSGETTAYDELLELEGTPRWWHTILTPARDETGRIQGLIGYTQDVTERKRAEEALKRSEERLRFTLEAVNDGVWEWDLQSGNSYWSPRTYTMLGYEPDEFPITYEFFRSFVHPDDLAVTEAEARRAIESGETFSVEFRCRCKDGSWRWLLSRGRCVERGERGRPRRVLGTHLDISERRCTEDALRQSEAALAEAQRVASIGSWNYDVVTGRLRWSAELYRIYGLDPEATEVGLDHGIGMIHPQDRTFATEAFRRAVEEGTPYEIEYRIRRPDGQMRVLQGIGKIERDSAGDIVGVYGTGQDITDRRRVEEEKALLQHQLAHAQKMEAVGEFAAGVAHDFNNLLTAITGNTELIAQASTGHPTIAQALEGIRDAAGQATGVTRSLLTFSAKMPPHKERLDLRQLIRKTARMVERMLPASIIIETDPDEAPPVWLFGEATQLQQVVLNLAVNARDAMPDGGTLRLAVTELAEEEAAIERRLLGVDDDGRLARLIVRDTGTGIDPEIVERVFEPFFTTKARGQGTGLGLAIVHGIVKEHGGRIEIRSVVGEGSTFLVTLPAGRLGTLDRTGQEKAAADHPCHGELVLLAEDNWNVRSILGSSLERFGFNVVEAADGHELMARFETGAADLRLIVIDIDLPGRSGLDCLRSIRRQRSDLPAILITGSGGDALENDLDENTVLLRKPFAMAELQRLAARMAATNEKERE